MRRFAITMLLCLAAGCATPPSGPKSVESVSLVSEAPAWSPDQPLQLDQAVELALQNDPRLKTMRAAVEVARIASRAATTPANPEFRGSYQENNGDDDLTGASEDTEELGGAIRFFPQRPWETRAKRLAADAAMQMAQEEWVGAECGVKFDVRRRFVELAGIDKDVEMLRRVVAARKARYEALKAGSEQGEQTAVDVLGAGLDYSDALARQGEAESSRRRASRALAAMIGAGRTTDLKIRPAERKRAEQVSDFDPAYLEKFALEHRMDVRAAEWRVREAWAAWKQASAARFPWFSYVQAGYGEEVAGDSASWSASFGVELPIFADPDRGFQVMAAELARVRAFEAEVRAGVTDDVLDALESLKEVDEDLRRFEQDMAPLIEELGLALKTASEAQTLGVVASAQIEVRLAQAERARLQAENRREQALIELEAALGAELPELAETQGVVEALPAQ